MSDNETLNSVWPVRRLVVQDPRLGGAVEAEVPWDLLTASVQQEIAGLDRNQDGTLTYTPARNQPGDQFVRETEVHHFDNTFDRFSRFLWRFQGASPNNNRAIDQANARQRMEAIGRMQAPLRQAAWAVLGNEEQRRLDRGRWVGAQRILSLTADYEGLVLLAHGAREIYDSETPHDIRYLLVAEDLLKTAETFASSVRDGQDRFLSEIRRELGEMRPDLERETTEREDRERLQLPYLFLGGGSPVPASEETLEEGGEITLAESVPQEFLEQNGSGVEEAIGRWYTGEEQVFLQRAEMRDRIDPRRFPLIPGRIVRDLPGSADDRTDGESSFYLDHPHLNRTLFKGHEMGYYRVGFKLPPGMARVALGDESLRSMDVVFVRNGQVVRRIHGAVNLQHRLRLESREGVTGDIHISNQDPDVLRGVVAWLEGEVRSGRRPDLARVIPELERYLGSINQRVRLMVELWREDYRQGRQSRGFVQGDFQDFVNNALVLVVMGYRSTSLRDVIQVLADAEIPTFFVPGNHDVYAARYQLSDRAPYFYGQEFYRQFLRFYDSQANPGEANLIERVSGILTRECSNLFDCAWQIFREVTAPNLESLTHDAFQGPQLSELAPYENYCTDLGTGYLYCLLNSRHEDYAYFNALDNRIPSPHLENMAAAAEIYVDHRKIHAVGPTGESFVALLRRIEAAERRERDGGTEERFILGMHHNAFSGGMGTDGTPAAQNVLRGDVALTFRVASAVYRTRSGRPRIAVVFGSHIHAWEEFLQHFEVLLSNPRFLREAEEILRRKNPETIYDEIWELCRRWRVNQRAPIEAVTQLGSDGYPGPIVRRFNEDSDAFGATLFVNTPTGGMGLATGDVRFTTRWDPEHNRPGRITVEPHYYRERPDGTVVESDGRDLPRFLQEEVEEMRGWGPTLQPIEPYLMPTEPTAVQILRGDRRKPGGFDFPSIYCNAGSYCLRVDLSPYVDLNTSPHLGAGLMLGASVVVIPEARGTHRRESGGGPYNFDVGFDYMLSDGRDRWRFRAGGDFGWLDIYPTVQTDFRRELAFGLQAEFVERSHLVADPTGAVRIYRGLTFVPGIRGWAQANLEGGFSFGLALAINPTLLSYEPPPETP